jgi:peptidyl-prolyl cis-trans isomerase B (cyclophilin B)
MNLSKLAIGVICVIIATAALPASAHAQENPVVVIETSMGDITVQLNQKRAPISVENFLKYVKEGFYDGTIFHRVIPDFMIQGGGFTSEMSKKATHEPIKNEAKNGLKNRKYTLAMARTADLHSATSQFFINTKDNEFLDNKGTSAQDYGYAVFGKVIEGKDVVDKIGKVKTGTKAGHQNVPMEAVVIKTIRLKTETE